MGKSPSTTTQVSKVELPKWVEQASQENYQFAKDVANRPFQQYQGQTVAGASDMQKRAWDLLKRNPAPGQKYMDQASDYYAQGAKPIIVGKLSDVDMSKYMNPYTDEVINRSLADM